MKMYGIKSINNWIITGVLIALTAIGMLGRETLEQVIETSGTVKKLPIYCVKTDKKRVALSFDAAWGNG